MTNKNFDKRYFLGKWLFFKYMEFAGWIEGKIRKVLPEMEPDKIDLEEETDEYYNYE